MNSITGSVFIHGTLTPWQWVLEGVEEVPHDPGYDGVVVHSNHTGHEHGCHTCEERVSILHPYISLSSPLNVDFMLEFWPDFDFADKIFT